MFINYVWRNCFPPALNIPVSWRNKDLDDYPNDKRVHAFYISMNQKEIQEQVMSLIKDEKHKLKIAEHCLVSRSDFATHNVLVGYDCSFVQCYPYFSLYESGSLFDAVEKTHITTLSQMMQVVELLDKPDGIKVIQKDMPGDL